MTRAPRPAPDFQAIFDAYPTAILVISPDLGMRVVSALADQLGAEIHAENAEPGARFTLIAPL